MGSRLPSAPAHPALRPGAGSSGAPRWGGTLWVGQQRRQAALGQDRAVLQQRAHKAPRGRLAQQVHQELDEALAVQQVGGRQGRVRLGLLRHRVLQHLQARRNVGNAPRWQVLKRPPVRHAAARAESLACLPAAPAAAGSRRTPVGRLLLPGALHLPSPQHVGLPCMERSAPAGTLPAGRAEKSSPHARRGPRTPPRLPWQPPPPWPPAWPAASRASPGRPRWRAAPAAPPHAV